MLTENAKKLIEAYEEEEFKANNLKRKERNKRKAKKRVLRKKK